MQAGRGQVKPHLFEEDLGGDQRVVTREAAYLSPLAEEVLEGHPLPACCEKRQVWR
jgi:hypothetical protein